MALYSKCPKCENTSFEIAEESPKGSRFKCYFIRCSSCGTVVSSTAYHNTTSILKLIAEKLGIKLDI